MATRTIHTLAYKMLVDSSKFEKGMVASRKELNLANKAMRETATPAEKLEKDIKDLNSAFNKGAISQETYRRKLDLLNAGYKKTGAEASRFSKIQKGIGASLLNVRNLMGVLAGAAAVRGLGRQVGELDKIAKAAAKLNVSTEFLTRFQFAAAQGAGLTGDQTTAAIEKMTIQLNKAGHETGRAKLILDKYGISLRTLVRATPEKTLFAVGNALSQIADQTERNVISGTIFGETQSGLHVLLGQTTDQIGALFTQSDKLGNTLSSFDAKKVELAADAIGEMGTAFGGLSRSFVTTIGPGLTSLLRELTTILERLAPNASSGTVRETSSFSDALAATTRTIGENVDPGRGFGGGFLNPFTFPSRAMNNLERVTQERVTRETAAIAAIQANTAALNQQMPDQRNRPNDNRPIRLER